MLVLETVMDGAHHVMVYNASTDIECMVDVTHWNAVSARWFYMH
jgi:hypothetical protein